jgi:hypothetical protein
LNSTRWIEESDEALHCSALGKRACVLDVNADVPNRALDLRVTEKDLYCAQVAGLLVDDRGFGPAQ